MKSSKNVVSPVSCLTMRNQVLLPLLDGSVRSSCWFSCSSGGKLLFSHAGWIATTSSSSRMGRNSSCHSRMREKPRLRRNIASVSLGGRLFAGVINAK